MPFPLELLWVVATRSVLFKSDIKNLAKKRKFNVNKAVKKYLDSCDIIDWCHPAVSEKAMTLAAELKGEEAITEACFIFVRDKISHSWDSQQNPITCRASAVLEHGTGYCYAKSHLLAALLRANSIPAGLCYQRLTIDHGRPPLLFARLSCCLS